MGKNSEVTWLQRLRQENKLGDDKGDSANASSTNIGTHKATSNSHVPFPESDETFSAHATNYHLDDETITTFEHVDPYEVPTAETAQNLFNAYITRVHPTFPIISKKNLTQQFQKFLSGQAQRPPEKWLAILNLIFAIAAQYSHLIQADWKGDDRDHIIYFTRARLLSVNSETVFQHPDLQMIQISGLIAFYFLCISQINRSWSMAGIAIRWATALGLNLRNDSTSLRDSLKEIRYRVWWALYTIEHRLGSMTGRVNCILDDHCTTPLPAPVEEDQFESEEGAGLLGKGQQQSQRAPFLNSNSPSASNNSSGSRSRSATKATGSRSPSSMAANGSLSFAKAVPPNSSLYFLHLVQLTRLTQSIFHAMYNPAAVQGSWSDVQTTMGRLSDQLEAWYRNLPTIFDFRRKQRDREFYEFRMNLGFFYYGTKMVIHRPCLCRLDRKIPHQSSKSLDFNHNAAMSCVDAARELLHLIPDEPNAVGLIKVGPWWSVLHSLVQACTVLMLEISFRAHHMPEEADAILDASKKGVRWLHALGDNNASAARAWGLCNSMLHDAAAKIGRDISDMPRRPPGRNSSSNSSGYGQSHSGMQGYSTPAPMTSSMMLQGYPAFSNIDQLMQYDQYFPMDGDMNGHMDGHMDGHMKGHLDGHMDGHLVDGQMNGHMPMPTDAEMEFMSNAYHNDGQHQPQVDGVDGHHGYGYAKAKAN